ncbi:MAG: hypothetical protein NTX25_18975, partial [Proteobacteria bacterium]|nr:hypothetical protein [Pseudomonadota bacterium]
DLAATPVHRGVAVDDSVGGEWRGPLDLLREELIAWAVDRFGVDSITEAKEEFFLKTGKVFHDDESYHRRMSYFLDYFLFDRPISRNLEATNQTPFELHQSHHRQEKLRSFTHSLFKVNRVLANGLLLKNLCNDEKLKISKQSVELFDGIVKGDIFQVFIFQLEDDLVLEF